MKTKHPKYIPKKCERCGQNETYLISLDHGTSDLMKAFYKQVKFKGINEIHPRQEMEVQAISFGLNVRSMVNSGKITSVMTGNLSKARFHGLLARIKNKPGYYCLTKKGFAFLSNERVYKFAIVSKVEKKQIGYLVPDELENSDYVTNIYKLTKDDQYWVIPVLDKTLFNFDYEP